MKPATSFQPHFLKLPVRLLKCLSYYSYTWPANRTWIAAVHQAVSQKANTIKPQWIYAICKESISNFFANSRNFIKKVMRCTNGTSFPRDEAFPYGIQIHPWFLTQITEEQAFGLATSALLLNLEDFPFSLICLPHDDPVNSTVLPGNYAPISPPIEATDIENFVVFREGDHLASASVKRSQSCVAISCVPILIHTLWWTESIMQWYRFQIICFARCHLGYATGGYVRPKSSEILRGLENMQQLMSLTGISSLTVLVGAKLKNGDVPLVVGFANLAHHDTCRLSFGPSSQNPTGTYRWSILWHRRCQSRSRHRRGWRVEKGKWSLRCTMWKPMSFCAHFEVTLKDNVKYPPVKCYVDPNRPHGSDPGTGGGSNSPSQEVQYRTQGITVPVYRLRDADDNTGMFYLCSSTKRCWFDPLQKLVPYFNTFLWQTAHPSGFLNDVLLAKVSRLLLFQASSLRWCELLGSYCMAITHDDDWSSGSVITQASRAILFVRFFTDISSSSVILYWIHMNSLQRFWLLGTFVIMVRLSTLCHIYRDMNTYYLLKVSFFYNPKRHQLMRQSRNPLLWTVFKESLPYLRQ